LNLVDECTRSCYEDKTMILEQLTLAYINGTSISCVSFSSFSN